MSEYKFDCSKDYILENHIVKLSPLQLNHIDLLADISKEDAIWTYFLETGQGKEKLKGYIQSAIQSRQMNQQYPFVVFDKRTNKFAGITRLYEYNQELGSIKMGHTWIGKEFWGTGLNKQYKFLLFKFIFESLNLERIGFGVHSENLRSIRALNSIGCQQEGVLRNFLKSISGETRVDLILFSLLKKEWEDKVKNTLEIQLN